MTDTEAKMKAAGQLLHVNHGIEHIYCLDHLLQLVAVIAYDADVTIETNDIEDLSIDSTEETAMEPPSSNKAVSKGLLKSICRLAGFFHKSSQAQAQAQLQSIQQEHNKNPINLIQDVVTWWWSTLAILD